MGSEITIVVPPSKSIVNRLLIIEAIGGCKILSPSDVACNDTFVLQQAIHSNSTTKHVELSGTAMRFLLALLSTKKGEWVLTGKKRLTERPIKPLVEALRTIGAKIEYLHNNDCLPVAIAGNQLNGGKIAVKSGLSSQFVSALMLIAPTIKNGLQIDFTSNNSLSYILLTKKIMEDCGVKVDFSYNTIKIAEQNYILPKQLNVESDWSGATFWYAFLTVSQHNSIKINNLFVDSNQPDSIIYKLFEQFGVSTVFSKNGIIISKKNVEKPDFYEYDFSKNPDLMPIFTSMLCILDIKFKFCGIENLRIKESDRVRVMVEELQKCGFILTESDKSLIWNGKKKEIDHTPQIQTHNDHRIAFAFALIKTKMHIDISNIEVVEKSYPNFFDELRKFG